MLSLDLSVMKIEELPLTCFITNVGNDSSQNEILEALEPFSEFRRVLIQGCKKPNQPLNVFVVFENKEQMEKAMKREITFENVEKRIKLVPAKWTFFHSVSNHCICVKGLTKNISEKDLKKTFKRFGEVLKIELVTKLRSKELTYPFAYIFFKNVEDASKVMVSAKVEINGVKVDVAAFKSNQQGKSNEKNEQLQKQGKSITIKECSRTLHVSVVQDNGNQKGIINLCSKPGKVDRIVNTNLIFDDKQNVNQKHIAKLFSECGKVDRVLYQIHKSDDKQNVKLFNVVFVDNEGYNKALNTENVLLDNYILNKSPLKWSSIPELYRYMVKIDGLPTEVKKEDLKSKFESCGSIVNIELLKLKKRPTSAANVFFKSPRSAKKAVSLDKTLFEGQTISVHQKRLDLKQSKTTVFIRKENSKNVTEDVIEKELEKFGSITKIHNGLKSFVVTFLDKAAAHKAIKTRVIKIAGATLQIIAHQEKSMNTLGVLVTGLAKGTELDQVLEHFRECGDIVRKYMGSSKRSSGARNTYAYLEFSSQQEKTKALKLSKSNLNGKIIFVGNSRPRV